MGCLVWLLLQKLSVVSQQITTPYLKFQIIKEEMNIKTEGFVFYS